MRELSGWGRYPVVRGEEWVSEDLETASESVSLMRGLGRSYGDASLPACEGGALALHDFYKIIDSEWRTQGTECVLVDAEQDLRRLSPLAEVLELNEAIPFIKSRR